MTTERNSRSNIKIYSLVAVALWTIFVGGLLAWSLHVERVNIVEQARVEARSIWSHNLSYRKWVTAMGGVYARADRMQPNPYLKNKDRDKTTTDGIALTLANPAYVTRQVFDIIRKESAQPIINRIVSEKYLNPVNKPDAWEEKGLRDFEAGVSEVSELTTLQGRPYMRLFRPMITTEGCLLCHGEQGYKVGDIRGGISVAVPMEPYERIAAAAQVNTSLIYFVLWGVGVGGILLLYLRVQKNQRQLMESEEKGHLLSAIVETSDDAIIAKDLNGIILSWNKGAEELYGYCAEEALGRSIAMLLPPDHSAELTKILNQLQRGERVEHYTTERLCKDGQQIAVSLSVSPIRDSGGHLVGASSIARDVTKRLEAEELLRCSEERLREAQRLAQVGSWELDLVKNVLIWSDEIYRIFEIDPAHFGASYEAFLAAIHPDDRNVVDAAYTEAVKNRAPYSIEHRLLLPGGRIKHVHEEGESTYAADGTPLRSHGTVQDITVLKQAEEEIHQLNADLESRVSQRTAELVESQLALMNIVDDLNINSAELEAANARLLELDRLKSMFIASMSHELRTPLNSIIGFSSILHDEWIGPVNPEQKENLAIVHRCGQYLLSLINDVIDVSKIEAGKIDVSSEEFDLRELLDEAVALVRAEAEGKGLALQVSAPSQWLYHDRRRLLQCVLNLLSNAVKFTESGSVSVTVQLLPDPPAAVTQVEVTVTDTGIGISAEDQQRMFQPFVRLVSPLQGNIPGTGLGLYLSQKLAHEILHGEILLRSAVGEGSSFTIRIPVRTP